MKIALTYLTYILYDRFIMYIGLVIIHSLMRRIKYFVLLGMPFVFLSMTISCTTLLIIHPYNERELYGGTLLGSLFYLTLLIMNIFLIYKINPYDSIKEFYEKVIENEKEYIHRYYSKIDFKKRNYSLPPYNAIYVATPIELLIYIVWIFAEAHWTVKFDINVISPILS